MRVRQSPKYIIIDYWLVGAIHRSIQTGVIFYIAYSLWVDQTWAYHEYPLGSVNAWAEPANIENALRSDYPSGFEYCSNRAHSFEYSSTFIYEAPTCKFIPGHQLITMGKGSVGVTTQCVVEPSTVARGHATHAARGSR